jgi:photosystem II stability/assembly factor-like uncharacterized protein
MRLKISVFLVVTSIATAAVVMENDWSYRSILDRNKQTSRGADLGSVSATRPLLPLVTASIGAPMQVSPDGRTVAEFSAATAPANPYFMAASAIDHDGPATNTAHCVVYVSTDGGSHWSQVSAWPTIVRGEFDPWVAIDGQNVIHATCVATTNMGARAFYIQSANQGASWTAPSIVTPLAGQFHRASCDKDALAVGSDGTIYVGFDEIVGQQFTRTLVVSSSADSGQTWTPHDTGVAGGFCSGIVTGPNGLVTVAFLGDAGYGTVTSTDGGNTWRAPVVLGTLFFQLPAIARESSGKTIAAQVAGPIPHLDIAIEDDTGSLVSQFTLDAPSSATCQNGRLIQPALTASPSSPAAFQIGCKVDPTRTEQGQLEVWLYPDVSQAPAPLQVISLTLPPVTHLTPFARRFPDGGDYWSLTWLANGWLSMWVDPRLAGGPGPLMAAPVVPYPDRRPSPQSRSKRKGRDRSTRSRFRLRSGGICS